MILFPHMLAGAIIGSEVSNYPLLILLSFSFHYIFDKIPHWDYLPRNISELNTKGWVLFMSKVTIDLLAGLVFIWIIFDSSPDLVRILTGTFFGILTDGLMLLNILTKQKNNLLKWIENFHRKFHFQNYEKAPLQQKLFWETTITAAVIIIIFLI